MTRNGEIEALALVGEKNDRDVIIYLTLEPNTNSLSTDGTRKYTLHKAFVDNNISIQFIAVLISFALH